ncbi:spore coat protein [Bacillus canaveralius]|uniref:Spore coat protein n=1 Tax=Bacillus canaveralius TaxID=1403243 RepID=A0A2N5GGN0_9BACI|nr:MULTISPECIES: spore coat protein [Bacillus]PLR79892.1 spore coat protein [Bacillus canaveralius]PLR82380.1 spore coat protein [Bacillus sp. V33-4]PLR96019.1 spore coat protein [Bacillus canaveralius]RSK51613.1 spore coat protein [Bacillus canaveralius]
MENQQEAMHENMHIGDVPQQLNHGGHEVLDVHEVLSGSVDALNTYLLFRQFVKDPELVDIIDRQYRFMQEEYNITLDSFKTGKDPFKPTQSYKMEPDNDFIYGIEPTEPVKPIQSVSEFNEQSVSSILLGAVKSLATVKTMAALESTNPVVRRVLADSIPNCIEMAYEISIYQNKRHYYQVPQFAPQDMQAMLNAYEPGQGQPQTQNNNVSH